MTSILYTKGSASYETRQYSVFTTWGTSGYVMQFNVCGVPRGGFEPGMNTDWFISYIGPHLYNVLLHKDLATLRRSHHARSTVDQRSKVVSTPCRHMWYDHLWLATVEAELDAGAPENQVPIWTPLFQSWGQC